MDCPLLWCAAAVSGSWSFARLTDSLGRSATPLEYWQSCWFCRTTLLILRSGVHLNSCVQSPDAGSGHLDLSPRRIVFWKSCGIMPKSTKSCVDTYTFTQSRSRVARIYQNLVRGSNPADKLKKPAGLVDNVFQLIPSGKHMIGRDLGRLEPMASLRYLAAGWLFKSQSVKNLKTWTSSV